MNLVTALKRRELEGKESEVDGDSDSSTGPSSSQQCAWCRKTGNKQVTLDTPTGVKVFCNEICFTQCRRASFKKSKTCDWCKHVRHTVNYVEFKDGETQLQFCSEKCLNQYKMSIFCKETQEHLRNVDKTGEISVDTKDADEREILITPELWMRGEHARRAAEARESARERERLEKREEKKQRKISSAKSPQKLSYKLDMTDKTRGTLFDRITHEANIKHRRSLITDRETSERASPVRSEKQTSPTNNNDTLYPAHLLSPWLHQAHMMGALMPGMMPYGHLSPMLLPGMLPPPPPAVLIPDNRDKDNQDDDKKDNKKSQHRRHTTPSLLSPASDVSATAGPSPGQDSKRDVSPSMADRRTSSLFPIDFPQFFAGQNMAAGLPSTTPLGQGIPGIPPVTMMVPFPVPLPLPVPIPIPIPLTVQQLKGLFGDKNDNKTNNMTPVPSVNTDIKETRSPVQSYIHSPQSVVSCGSDLNTYDKQEPRSGSRNSCPDLSMFVGASDLRTKRTNGQQIKRSRTPDSMKSLDLSKRSKYPKYDYNIMCSDSNDGVIDLSASRMNGIKAEDTESENDVSMLNASSDTMMSRDDDDSNAGDAPKVPKIHIITHKDETPLNQPLPLPPTDNSYSSRRGLILDAPTVQKKSRSPSPERRVYVRNVPRDIIEAARRRCMRARIRTK